MTSSFTPSGGGSLRQGQQPGGAPIGDIPIGNSFEACPDRPLGSLRGGGRAATVDSFSNGRGAGRSFEYVYPVPSQVIGAGDAGISGLTRYGYVDSQQVSFAQAPAGAEAVYYKGRVAFRSHAPTGVIGSRGPAMPFPALKGGAPQRGDYECWRAKAILAFEPNGVVDDLGLLLAVGGGSRVRVGNDAGIGLRVLANNTVEVYARAVAFGPITLSNICPIVIAVAEWNCYELRVVGATDTQDALLRVLINNQEQFRFSFGDGLLPVDLMQMSILSNGAGTYYLPMGGACCAAAYDEASLL